MVIKLFIYLQNEIYNLFFYKKLVMKVNLRENFYTCKAFKNWSYIDGKQKVNNIAIKNKLL
jgi:hypothetical protein